MRMAVNARKEATISARDVVSRVAAPVDGALVSDGVAAGSAAVVAPPSAMKPVNAPMVGPVCVAVAEDNSVIGLSSGVVRVEVSSRVEVEVEVGTVVSVLCVSLVVSLGASLEESVEEGISEKGVEEEEEEEEVSAEDAVSRSSVLVRNGKFLPVEV